MSDEWKTLTPQTHAAALQRVYAEMREDCPDATTTPEGAAECFCQTFVEAVREAVPSAVPMSGLLREDGGVDAGENDRGVHWFVRVGRLHYDAETPWGVFDPADLPFFGRARVFLS